MKIFLKTRHGMIDPKIVQFVFELLNTNKIKQYTLYIVYYVYDNII